MIKIKTARTVTPVLTTGRRGTTSKISTLACRELFYRVEEVSAQPHWTNRRTASLWSWRPAVRKRQACHGQLIEFNQGSCIPFVGHATNFQEHPHRLQGEPPPGQIHLKDKIKLLAATMEAKRKVNISSPVDILCTGGRGL